MLSLAISCVAHSFAAAGALAAAPELVLARRGGGALVRGGAWLFRGIQTGNPAAIGIGALCAGGGAWWLYNAAKNSE